jgi:arylsulfatase A-like enzyme
MSKAKNILFIMCDQLRADYLSCYGHPHLHTPHIDNLAARGVRFTRAYVQSPICGPSRMSFYTGRYMVSHGSTWNGYPLRIGERTIGDYLRPLGMRVALVGKTHMRADAEGMAWLGIDPNSDIGEWARECGFEPYERDDGLHPDPLVDPDLRYNQYLRNQGYQGHNPWHTQANAAIDEAGNLLSGWYLQHATRPANIQEEHSETPYMTGRAIDFIKEAGDQPWCLHLSYIKPHWPYMAPGPYHDIYGQEHILPAKRSKVERQNPHPVYAAFMQHPESRSFQRDDVREAVIPAYMGLIKQIDDQIGRLMTFLEQSGHLQNTLIVFTSDHGDYLGDHWLGEKDLFHEESIRIPLIIYDPSAEADPTRGRADHRFVESIDLAATFLDVAGGPPQPHRLEGRSLLPLLHGQTVSDWREFVMCESDYSGRGARVSLGLAPEDCYAYMIRTTDWKYILHETFGPQLYDLKNDPAEFHDLGADPAYEAIRRALHEQIFTWLRKRKTRITISDDEIHTLVSRPEEKGILIGYWSSDELPGETRHKKNIP